MTMVLKRAPALGLALLAVGLAGCVPADQPPERATKPVAVSRAPEGKRDLPMVDPSQACVPPEEIYFDTFRGSPVRFTKASKKLILRLRDAIPPLTNPKYDDVSGGDWLGPDDLVLGYTDGDESYAYPFKILNFHEIVNEEINGRPVLISYCPLCNSALVFSRVLEEEALTFGNTSALFESDLVMYDHQTGSYWHQVGGQAIVGPLCEKRLELLPSITTTWAGWKALHPTTRVLSRDTDYNRPYERDSFSGYPLRLNAGQFAFPVSEKGRDGRLRPADVVLGVELGDARRAYPLSHLGDAVVEDTLGKRRIVIFTSADGPSGAAYIPQAGAQPLTFQLQDGRFMDRETESVWNLAGVAVDGPLAGRSLEPVPARFTFWFALVATYPGIELHHLP